MTNKKRIIAIDGFSSTGKSSISKEIAKKLGIIHLDTGALYRGITYFALSHCVDNSGIDLSTLFQKLNDINLEFKEENSNLILFLNGEDISKEIRTQKVSDNVSLVAKQPEVRAFLLQTQREIAEKGGAVLDGRDIGTVVFPNADYKFFLTASVEKRTERRYKELQEMGIPTDYEAVKQNLIERDRIDSTREVAPLTQAEDAILIDNSDIDKEQTLALMLSYIK